MRIIKLSSGMYIRIYIQDIYYIFMYIKLIRHKLTIKKKLREIF